MFNGFRVFPYTQPPKITRKKVSLLLNQPMKSSMSQGSSIGTIMSNARSHNLPRLVGVITKNQLKIHETSNFHALEPVRHIMDRKL